MLHDFRYPYKKPYIYIEVIIIVIMIRREPAMMWKWEGEATVEERGVSSISHVRNRTLVRRFYSSLSFTSSRHT